MARYMINLTSKKMYTYNKYNTNDIVKTQNLYIIMISPNYFEQL